MQGDLLLLVCKTHLRKWKLQVPLRQQHSGREISQSIGDSAGTSDSFTDRNARIDTRRVSFVFNKLCF